MRSVTGTSFLLVLLGFSLALNVVLGWQVRSANLLTKQGKGTADSSHLIDGERIAQLTVKRLDGTEQAISFSDTDRPTVLYVFSLTCVWSRRNADRVQALAKATSSTHRFIGLSLRDVVDAPLDAEQQKLGFSVFKGVSSETVKSMGLGSTPQTIVVSPQGIVLKNWVGFYDGELKNQVESYFRVPLPEVAEDKQIDIPYNSPQSCTRCVLDGLFYSTGAVVTTADRRLRCGIDGRWVEF